MASLAAISNVSVPAGVGYQLPTDGGAGGDQTYTVKSSNPSVGVSVAQGEFLTIGVSHASSGSTDIAFAGTMTFQLFGDYTPTTVARIEELVQQGFYTSPTTSSTAAYATKNFHRVASGFPDSTSYIVQGGSQSGDGTGSLSQPGFPFGNEYNQQLVFDGSGQLAMANAGDNTNDSQFFITTGQPRSLDFKYTIFGQMVSGTDILDDMTKVAVGSDGTTPVDPILFTSTTLSTTNPDGVIHIDATGATAGEVSTITVTATDTSGASTSQSFTATVVPNDDSTGTAIVEPPFLAPVTNQVVAAGQTDVFKITGIDATPGQTLTYNVGVNSEDSTNPVFTTIPAADGTATVDANGVVTVTPAAGFAGTISFLVGVRDQVNRSGTGTGQTIDNINNYDQKAVTLTVTTGSVTALQPIAVPGAATVVMNTATTVDLTGNNANPQATNQALTYTLLSQPQDGTISNFDATTGAFTYTPNTGFIGTDAVPFEVSYTTDGGAVLTSAPATETLTVTGVDTGAVRLIGSVLVVTPPPKAAGDKSRNTIAVDEVNGNVQVTLNGEIDATSPANYNVSQIIVYGSKNGDTITVGPEVTIPASLDGGHGDGLNVIQAGGGSTTEHGWFGKNVLIGGSGATDDALIGRAGSVKFVKGTNTGSNLLFTGTPEVGQRKHVNVNPTKLFSTKPMPPKGTFYKFVGKKVVAIKHV